MGRFRNLKKASYEADGDMCENHNKTRKVKAVRKSHFIWLTYLAPVVIAAVYIIFCSFLLPNISGETISITLWLKGSQKEIAIALQDPDIAATPPLKIWAVKTFLYLLWAGFIGALFHLGRVLHNKKPEYHSNAVLKDKEPYQKAMGIYETIKYVSSKDAGEAKTAVRNVMEKLRTESAFGFGSDDVIDCENDIEKCLKEIDRNIKALSRKNAGRRARDVIVANCNTIQTKLKLRTEMKKK